MKTHKDLKVWQESIKLVTTIYDKTKSFPKDEIFSLTSQMRRCAISIPSNIAEIGKMLSGLIKFRKGKPNS